MRCGTCRGRREVLVDRVGNVVPMAWAAPLRLVPCPDCIGGIADGAVGRIGACPPREEIHATLAATIPDLTAAATGRVRDERIERLYAWLVTGRDGKESVPMVNEVGARFPVISADRAWVESHREEARALARLTGFPARLVCFEHRLELETLTDA